MNPKHKHYCEVHPHARVNWVCLDLNCASAREALCPFCLPASHSECRKEMQLKYSQIFEKLKLVKRDFDDSEFYAALTESLEEATNSIKERIRELAFASKSALSEFMHKFEKNPLEVLNSHKALIRTVFNKDARTIEIVHSLGNCHDLKNDRLESIKNKLKKLADSVLEDLVHRKWEISSRMKPRPKFKPQPMRTARRSAPALEDFKIRKITKPKRQPFTGGSVPPASAEDLLTHKDFNVSLKDQVFEISRNIKQDKRAYLIYNRELSEGMTFKVTITAINACDRELLLGVVDLVKYNFIRQQNFEGWGNGFALWLDGFSHYNLSGKYPAVLPSDPQGFKPGDELFVEYKAGLVFLYNKSKSIDLISSKLGGVPPYYFILFFWRKEVAATLERLF